jgi:hypothetical protein
VNGRSNCSALPALHRAPEFLAALLCGAADGLAGFLRALAYFLADLLGALTDIMHRRTGRVTRTLGVIL